MVRSRSSAASNESAGSPSMAEGSGFFLPAIRSSRAHGLDAGVGFAAREFEPDAVARRERDGGTQHTTARVTGEAIPALEHQPRRQRPQLVDARRHLPAPTLDAAHQLGAEGLVELPDLGAPVRQGAGPLAQYVAPG